MEEDYIITPEVREVENEELESYLRGLELANEILRIEIKKVKAFCIKVLGVGYADDIDNDFKAMRLEAEQEVRK